MKLEEILGAIGELVGDELKKKAREKLREALEAAAPTPRPKLGPNDRKTKVVKQRAPVVELELDPDGVYRPKDPRKPALRALAHEDRPS